MVNILFVFTKDTHLSIISFFEDYKENVEFIEIDNSSLIPGIKKNVPSDIYDSKIFYKYKNYNIHVILNNIESVSEFLETYDKIYIFKNYVRHESYSSANKFDKVNYIYLNLDERVSSIEEGFLNKINNNKIISGGNIPSLYKNYFRDYKINFKYFFYDLGYNYLNLNYTELKKDNLLGFYNKKEYKITRDNFVSKMEKMCKFNIKNYSNEKYSTLDWALHLWRTPQWHKVHTSSFTDYQTSVVGFVFETLDLESDYESINRIEYISEKSLKPLLFSFLKIPFILNCNPYSFIELNEDGFWFFNSEFFNYNESDDFYTLKNKLKKSIFDSLDYLNELNLKYSGNLDEIHLYFKNKYGDKMDKNFKKTIEYINTSNGGDKLLDFILK